MCGASEKFSHLSTSRLSCAAEVKRATQSEAVA
jgi:hypothetical protein